ncbi:uncharacterized protein BCR38DRAFT_366772 [Pseudomassariella vexata]|uniref:Glycosyltransferase family 25 protein n=1 Tax=Pseudomassariella vexata TaxID=1141098 RepID=A0A1Y2E433_9PEZI|nr:uncharacterized protein BCR38DRAFT_366772 [Pseudomassariella vexata]ORY66311.1 hypothetical protein BCR38DRAFT_366772 [Pseudomassariella vexata]
MGFLSLRIIKILLIATALCVTLSAWTLSWRLDLSQVSQNTVTAIQEWSTDYLRRSNRTLGFEKILVISTGSSWRLEGLLKASNFTGFDVEVPRQPQWTSQYVDEFRGIGTVDKTIRVGPGQARCWLGHLNALSYMIEREWATALIMEDDVDWDIAIKEQFALVAPHIRSVTQSWSSSARLPYGNKWDLLWVGHCGDAIPKSGGVYIFDDTLPRTADYRENNGRHIQLTSKPQQRVIHISDGPVCTYAYALTLAAARKVFQHSRNGVENIITTDLRQWCQAGFLTCVTVNPELFHHHKKAGEVSSEIAVVEGWDSLATPASVDFTANIRYSARCNSVSSKLVTCIDETIHD